MGIGKLMGMAVACLAWSGVCAAGVGVDGDRVVAKVGGEKITLLEVLQRFDAKGHDTQRAIDEIVASRLTVQEALASGIPDVTEADFQKSFSLQLMSLPNLSDPTLQADWRVGMLRERLLEKLAAGVTVTDEELKKKFDDVRGDLQPETAVIRWIILKTEGEARTIVDRLRHGAAFGDLAKTASIEEVSAKAGGLVGAVRPDKIPGELAAVIFAPESKPGLVADPIVVKNAIPFYGPEGWYVVSIDRIVRQGEMSLEQGRPVAEYQVRKDKATALLERNLAKRRKQSGIWIDKNLPSLVKGAKT